MSGRPVLVWIRRDLRLADNPALDFAIRNGSSVVPVFVWAPEEDGCWAPGSASRWWLHQSLRALQAGLRDRGSNLIVRRGPTPEALLKLAAEAGARAVYWNRLWEPAAIVQERKIQAALWNLGLAAESFPGNLLFEPGTILNSNGRPFTVFTAFWNACLKAPAPVAPLPTPAWIPAPKRWPGSVDIADLELEPKTDWAGGIRETWRPGESSAAERLRGFLEGAIEQYSDDRDRPDHEGTSRLSPHLHFGEISVRQIWQAASLRPAYLRQLAWREFAYHLLFHFPETTEEPLRPTFRSGPSSVDKQFRTAWTRGRTGYPIVDAGMRQLWRSGWMHNRVRMIVGSFLVKHLLVPWQEGARWFWDTLVDADLANNTLGWQWVAGCGANAAPYFRMFNPVIQGKKFDPAGDYVRRWVPELVELPVRWIHEPWMAPAELRNRYPPPIVEHAMARRRFMLWASPTNRGAG